MAEVYWKDEDGVEHEVLKDRFGDYYVEDGDTWIWLNDEDLIELGLVEEEDEEDEDDGFDWKREVELWNREFERELLI